MVMNVAASAPVRRGFGGQERDADAFGEGVGVLSVARSDVFRCRCLRVSVSN